MSTTIAVAIVRTGGANLASVTACLARAGVRAVVTADPQEVLAAPMVILPGVGAFGPAMSELRRTGVDEAIAARVQGGGSLLAICLGLQLLCEASEESPGVAGLGLLPGVVRRFAPGTRSPQLGWNLVTPSSPNGLVRGGYAYYANSYRLEAAPAGWSASWSSHGGPFIAAIERGPVLACQFHPELSGEWGQRLVGSWLAAAARAGVMTC